MDRIHQVDLLFLYRNVWAQNFIHPHCKPHVSFYPSDHQVCVSPPHMWSDRFSSWFGSVWHEHQPCCCCCCSACGGWREIYRHVLSIGATLTAKHSKQTTELWARGGEGRKERKAGGGLLLASQEWFSPSIGVLKALWIINALSQRSNPPAIHHAPHVASSPPPPIYLVSISTPLSSSVYSLPLLHVPVP